MRPIVLPLALLATGLLLLACPPPGGGEGEGEGEDDAGVAAGCSGVTNVSDGPTADAISQGATAIVCYYAQPSEGYCRRITDPGQISSFYDNGNDKGAIGCADAVIITDGQCPTANAVGRCENNNIEAERVYYECTKFSDPAGNCSALGGTFTAL
jgi:hypothetical protein